MVNTIFQPPPLDWPSFSFRYQNMEHIVYHKGSGAAVLLMHELPGMIPECVHLAERIVERGYTVYLPLFFGQPNKPFSLLTILRYAAHICISREFNCLAKNQSSPITEWLRALCREKIYPQSQATGIGAIGMCLTGGFVLSLMLEEQVIAPVVCQPSLPLRVTPEHKKALGISPSELEQAKAKAQQCPILAFRFEEDTMSPPERIESLRQTFAHNIEINEISAQQRKESGIKTEPLRPPHSVLTVDAYEPAIQRVFQFLDERLAPNQEG
ncbi:MAG: dienelactone hydrolase family protein [Prochloraceae cyanobacterium]